MMSLKEKLLAIANKTDKISDNLLTEEATKNALVMPFIQALGYDVFNPEEVLPEYISDFGIKKGEKVDYVIMREGIPAILVECKHVNQKLDIHGSQLFRYFTVTQAKFAILTNGLEYRFYTDIEHPNKMDEKPFLKFNIKKLRDNVIEELAKFQKETFDIDAITDIASNLKYTSEIRTIIEEDMKSPSDDLVHYFTGRVHEGKSTKKVIEQFRPLVKNSYEQTIAEIVNRRLSSALEREEKLQESKEVDVETNDVKTQTTQEELEGYYTVRSILWKVVDLNRVVHRDQQSYFGILFDDNSRKPICRLHFNTSQKYISTFDADKNETKYKMESLDEIYKYRKKIIEVVKNYLLE